MISIPTVQRLTDVEKETYEGRAIINEFYSDNICRFKEEEYLTYDREKPNPEDLL